jgi:hypothetical protein
MKSQLEALQTEAAQIKSELARLDQLEETERSTIASATDAHGTTPEAQRRQRRAANSLGISVEHLNHLLQGYSRSKRLIAVYEKMMALTANQN